MFGLNNKHENPLEDDEEFVGTYSFTGELIQPWQAALSQRPNPLAD